MVNRVVPPDQVLAEAVAYAQDVAANCSPASVAAIKGQVHRHITMEFEEACADSDRLMVQSLKGPDFKEGVSATSRSGHPNLPRSAKARSSTDRSSPGHLASGSASELSADGSHGGGP